jgi:hypothetical protein
MALLAMWRRRRWFTRLALLAEGAGTSQITPGHVAHRNRFELDSGPENRYGSHTMARKLAFLVGVSPHIVINHLNHDLEMKRDHLAGISKSRKSGLRSDHAGRAWCSRLDKCLISPHRRRVMDDVWPHTVETIGTGSRFCRLKGRPRSFRGRSWKSCCELESQTGERHREAKWVLWTWINLSALMFLSFYHWFWWDLLWE